MLSIGIKKLLRRKNGDTSKHSKPATKDGKKKLSKKEQKQKAACEAMTIATAATESPITTNNGSVSSWVPAVDDSPPPVTKHSEQQWQKKSFVAVVVQPRTNSPLPNRGKPLLPPLEAVDEGKLTVVLDMDETLLHSKLMGPEAEEESGSSKFDVVVCDEEMRNRFGVLVRPMVRDFLRYASQHFEVVVCTAAHKNYGKPVLDWLDPDGHIKHRLFRDSCLPVDGMLVKPMQLLGRDLARTVLVDNSEVCMLASPDNGLLMPDYFGGSSDTCIKHLADILGHMHICDDVRPFLKEKFQMRGRLAEQGLVALDDPGQRFCERKTEEIASPKPGAKAL